MLKAAVAVMLAVYLAGAEAPDEPPRPIADHSHGPIVQSAKRLKKARVTPASMEEDAARENTAAASPTAKNSSGAWKRRRPIPTSPQPTVAARPSHRQAPPASPDEDRADSADAAEESADDVADRETAEQEAPGKLPDDLESTAIEPAAEDATTDEAAEEPDSENADGANADDSDRPSPAEEESSEEDPLPVVVPKKTRPVKTPSQKPAATTTPAVDPQKDKSTEPRTVVPTKKPKPATAPKRIPTSASDSSKPGVKNAAPLKPTLPEPPVGRPRTSQTPVAPALDPQSARLRDRVRRALALYYQRPVNARDHTPWETFHWIIAYNVYAEIQADGPWGQRTNAVGWLCYNRPCHGQHLLGIEQGRLKAQYGVGLQGHEGQFLAILAQSRVMINYPIRVNGRSFEVSDLVQSEMLGCKTGTELTFKLIALSHYLELNSQWKSADGDTWSIPRLIREEMAKPIQGAACGGTHRLMGLSYAVRMRRLRGEPIDGEYKRAEAYVRDYHRYAFSLQNPDGSFSTNWLAGREAKPDIDRRVQTTGHILEWLVFSLPEQELKDPRVVQCVKFLSDTLLSDPSREWKIGPLGHALRALTLYDRQMFEPFDAPEDDEGLVEMDAVDTAPLATHPTKKSAPIHSAARPKAEQPRHASQPAVKEVPIDDVDEIEEEATADESAMDESGGDEPSAKHDDDSELPEGAENADDAETLEDGSSADEPECQAANDDPASELPEPNSTEEDSESDASDDQAEAEDSSREKAQPKTSAKTRPAERETDAADEPPISTSGNPVKIQRTKRPPRN